MTRILSTLVLAGCCGAAWAQQLEPRAYSVSPTGVNIVLIGYTHAAGDLNFDPSIPIDNGSARINATVLGYFRSLNVFGRSANVSAAVPYSWGHLQGNYLGEYTQIYRSGPTDSLTRFSINLYGAPAMKLKEFARYKQKTNIGATIVVTAPTGQYDPNKAINLGTNRWSFKPEVGFSRAIRQSRMVLDGYFGVWMFTANPNVQGRKRTQDPIGTAQFHLSYDLKPRLWAAFDATFYRGGRTYLDGVRRNDLQSNSRIGGTVSIPVARRQSVKFSYSVGLYTTIGGDFQMFSAGYQYLWGGGL